MTLLTNPVLPGFSPDPSLIRVGGWFYLANSSFEWYPAIPIHRSRDLATWEYAGSLDGAVLQFRWSQDGRPMRSIGPALNALALSDDHGGTLRYATDENDYPGPVELPGISGLWR